MTMSQRSANLSLDAMESSIFSSTRRNSIRYDVTGTMGRLRSSMVGSLVNVLATENNDTEESPQERTNLLGTSNTESVYYDKNAACSIQQQEAESSEGNKKYTNRLTAALAQIPAIALIGMFHLMIGIPFGVSYFPIGWNGNYNNVDQPETQNEDVHGPFPLPGKEALGIRMFLFSTMVGQIVFTFTSNFINPIGLQMVENVPFCHALCNIVIRHQGYGADSLSTLFVMFGLASLIVGIVFYTLGKYQLGSIVYFFPTHVLVGCIGGIGVYLVKTAMEVTINDKFGWETVSEYFDLLLPVFVFEIILRVMQRMTLDRNGKPKYALLSPLYFCLITPLFYLILWSLRVDVKYAQKNGYFFPPLDDPSCDAMGCTKSSSIWNDHHLFDIFRQIHPNKVSWEAITDAFPTLVALTLFSLIHVPINIPAFAISTNTEADMNVELVAHGYSNILAGLCGGGLQNYMAYTQSVLYDRSGGRGRASGVAVAALTGGLFVIGPTIASYIPRCMAGTLLLHVGADLFIEGVYDSYHDFDLLEYSGIWLIVIVMTLYGMDAAMIAGILAAVSTYAVQSITYPNAIRGSMSAATLRSSHLTRNQQANDILDDQYYGRQRIFVIQLQGHLFFGNMAQLTDNIRRLFCQKRESMEEPWIVIIDFSLVLGIDSSAAQAIVKLGKNIRKTHGVKACTFVSGSTVGFPCAFDLSQELLSCDSNDKYCGSYVFESLDSALVFAEDALIYWRNPSLLNDQPVLLASAHHNSFIVDEKTAALHFLRNLCPGTVDPSDIETLFNAFIREEYRKDEYIWHQGSPSDCAKLVVVGTLISILENEAGTSEIISTGNTIGELGLVHGTPRLSSVRCLSDSAVLYSLSSEAFQQLGESKPKIARLVDRICVKYLANRVQHVSNRIFETRCLPI